MGLARRGEALPMCSVLRLHITYLLEDHGLVESSDVMLAVLGVGRFVSSLKLFLT